MDGGDGRRRWKNLKRRVRSKLMGCCGAHWAFTSSNSFPQADEDEEETAFQGPVFVGGSRFPDPGVCSGATPAGSFVSLATALAAERDSGAAGTWNGRAGPGACGGPVKALARLMEEESDGGDEERSRRWRRRRNGNVCCGCMERSRGAAFIPCGHTFCRPCSRDLRVKRGSCPICNRPILEVLDIF